MIDLLLDEVTHDLVIDGNDLALTTSDEYIAQKLKIKLQFFFGEWFLDRTVGVPYHEDFLIKVPNLAGIDSILKAKILQTDGVQELTSFVSSFDRAARVYTVAFKVRTTSGDLSLTLPLGGV